MRLRKLNFYILIILGIAIFIRLYIVNFLPLETIGQERLLTNSFFNILSPFSAQATILLGLGNMVLIWLAGKRLCDNDVGLFSALLYAVSPWTFYLDVSGSSYVWLIFLLLILFLGISTFLDMKKIWGLIVATVSCVLLLYSSLFFWILFPIAIWITVRTRILSLKQLGLTFMAVLILLLPLVTAMSKNTEGLLNAARQQVTIFSNVGLLNAVNQYQGESRQSGYILLSRVIENRYSYYSQHLLFNLFKQLSPVVYFTHQEQLFGFSFSPPIYLGFLIPFILGFSLWRDLWRRHGPSVIWVTVLFLPSVLSVRSPDLIRLSLVSPLIFLTISYGLVKWRLSLNNRLMFCLFCMTVFLVLFQGVTTLSDIALREPVRLERMLEKR